MKLISSKSNKGKRVIKRSDAEKKPVATKRTVTDRSVTDRPVNNESITQRTTGTKRPDTQKNKKRSSTWSLKKKIMVSTAGLICLILLFGIGTFAVIWWEIQPLYDHFFKPDMSVLAEQVLPSDRPVVSKNPTVVSGSNNNDPDTDFISNTEDNTDEDEALTDIRNLDIITFLLLGIDLDGNTDVIKVAAFDIVEQTLNIVSIPRDTIVNVPWNLRKVNSIHGYARNKFRGQNVASDDIVEETVGHFRNLLGYNIDFMVTISMAAFPRIVDAIGGVQFDVPRSMNVDGVRVSRGNQRLGGQQALVVMRDRDSHPDGDIGRANTQSEFLNAVMKQFLANRSSVKVDDMADIFLRHTNTNIPLVNLVWLGKEFLKMDAANINFYMMPGEFEALRGNFYISVQLEPWLELVNEKISPLNFEIIETDVSILTRGPDRRLYVTDGNWLGDSSWGGSGTGSSNPQTTNGGLRPNE